LNNRANVATNHDYRASVLLYVLGALLVGELAIRPGFGLTVSDLFFLLAFAALIVEGMVRTVPLRLGLPLLVLVGGVLFTIGGLISSLYSSHSRASFVELARLDYVLLVWLWMGPQIIRSTRQLSLAMRFWTISAAIAGAGAVVQLIFGDVIPNTHSAFGRMTGLTQHVNDLGGLTAIALAPSLMFTTLPGISHLKRFLGIAVTVLILTGLILSGSVTGFVAAGFGVLAWVLTTKPNRRFLFILGILVISGLGVVALQGLHNGVSPEARLLEVLGGPGDQATGLTRLQVDFAALEAIRTQPFLGVGLDSASYINAVGDLVHNILLEVWLGAGLLGFVGLALILGAGARAAIQALHDFDGAHIPIAHALLASYVAFIVLGLAAPILLSRYAWLPVAMLMILRELRLRDESAVVGHSEGSTVHQIEVG
jgi:O-antigen ligase